MFHKMQAWYCSPYL